MTNQLKFKELRNNAESYLKSFEDLDHLGNLIGAKPISVSKTECIFEYIVNPDHFNPNGFLHGGALFTVMDSSQGLFLHYVLDDKFNFAVTGTATIRYEKAVSEGTIQIRTFGDHHEGRKYFVKSVASKGSEILAILDEVWIAIEKK